jgi:hypothetical protein
MKYTYRQTVYMNFPLCAQFVHFVQIIRRNTNGPVGKEEMLNGNFLCFYAPLKYIYTNKGTSYFVKATLCEKKPSVCVAEFPTDI